MVCQLEEAREKRGERERERERERRSEGERQENNTYK
jgi:hypothetical protein